MTTWFFSLIAFVLSLLPQPTFREGVLGQPKSLNPFEVSTNQADRDLARFLFRALMKYNEKGDLVTDLAESYKVSGDLKEYLFYLHKNVHWHDGNIFNADDVIETIARFNLQVVEVDKIDNFTVRFRLVRDPYAPLLDLLTVPMVPAGYKHKVASSLGNVTGLGDYRLARIKRSGRIESVILTRAWPWQKSKNFFSRIIFNYYQTNRELEQASRLGEFDAAGVDQKSNFAENFQTVSAPLGSRYYALFLNLEKEPLKDREIRNFLKSLTPVEKIVSETLPGGAVSAYGPLEYTFASPRPSTPSAVRAKAPLRKKLEGTLTITVPEASGSDAFSNNLTKVALKIQAAWQAAGLKTEIRTWPLESLFSEIIAKKDFQLLLFGQEVERDPDVYTLWHSAQTNLPGLNFVSFRSPLADKSLEDGRKAGSLAERKLNYVHFLKSFTEEVPAIFLYHPLYTYAYKKEIAGPSLLGFFKATDRFINFENWRRL